MTYYTSQEELHHLLHHLKSKYLAIVQSEERVFLCTALWLHGPAFWKEFTKGHASQTWCEMMNNCLVQAINNSLFFGCSLELTVHHFFDLDHNHLTLISDFVHSMTVIIPESPQHDIIMPMGPDPSMC